ncbi:MAG: peptidylprolyl isomerase [Pseudomonadota bacterium]
MQIADKSFVAIDYRLTLESGEEVDSSADGQPLTFITGSGQIIPGLENGLMGMKAGDADKITVEPEDGYGPKQDDMMQDIPRDNFPGDMEIEPGMQFQANGPHGPVMLTVSRVNDKADTVTVDLNHPLAGQRLYFDVTVREVREPSADELSQLSSGCGCGCGSAEKGSCGPNDGCGSGGSCGCC